jgi:hypothetical protein
MGGTCSTYERAEWCIQGFGIKNLRKRDHLEDIGIEREDNIKMDLQVGWGGHAMD